jgi:PAS domain S-box-containing protein
VHSNAQREELLSSILRAAPIGIGLVVERVLRAVNARLCEMTGYSEEELLGKNARMLYPDDAAYEYVGQEKYRQIALYGTGTVETQWLRKDGQIIDVLLSSTPLDVTDQLKGVTFTALDITERKAAEAALKQSEQRLHTLLAAAPLILFATDAEGAVTFVEGRSVATVGLEPSRVIGARAFDYFAEQPLVRTALEAALRGETFNTSGKVADTWFEARLSPLRDEHGAVVGVIGVALDITERRRGEEKRQELELQLIHSQKMEAIGRLAGSVAHDFNNLLTVIGSYADIGLMQVREGDPLSRELREIGQASERAARLTRQLLAFSRRQILRPETLDLDQVLQGMEPMLRRLIGEDIELELVRRPGLGLTLADPGQIEQVVMNLVVNARDAMPDGGRLTLETAIAEIAGDEEAERLDAAPGRYVVLQVSDTGCGMDEAVRARLFEPFFSTKEPGKGTGLGLATVYGIIEQSGGGVAVRSTPGEGATFRVYLPRIEVATPIRRSEAPAITSCRGTERILVVEDDVPVRGLVLSILTAAGYTVITAATGDEALRACEDAAREGRPIDALLTDVIMPGMNGRDLAAKLRGVYPRLKVVFMSGYTDDVIGHHGVLEPEVRLINKPFKVAELERQVREALDEPPE